MTADDGQSEAGGLQKLTRLVALAGGFAVVGVSAITVVSVIGRYAFGTPLTGDYEIVEYGISIAAFFFLAFAHATDSHIIAEFFSSKTSARTRRRMDTVQNFILFLILVVLTWQVALGGIDKFETDDQSMFLAMRTWWLHLVGTFGLALFAWVALAKLVRGLRGRENG